MPFVSQVDEQYIQSIADPAIREAATCAVTTYRRPDRLKAGDRAPVLELTDLQAGLPRTMQPTGKPLVLIFGSYT